MAHWFDAALLAAGLLATAAAAAAVHLIGAAGGFRLNPVSSQLTSIGALPGHVYQTVAGLALVFGGDFFGQPAGPGTLLLLLHLAGLALAVWAVCAGLRRLRHAGLIAAAAAGRDPGQPGRVRRLDRRDQPLHHPGDRRGAAVRRRARGPAAG